MSLATPEAAGPLRRERLRTARLYFVCEAAAPGRGPRAAAAGRPDRRRRHRPAARQGARPAATLEIAGQTFRRLCDTYSALFIVNDDPSLARACDADGVHVGQDDVAVAEAREMLGPEAIIGLSTHSEQQIAAAEGVDYISVGPVWETPTKEGRPAVGLELVRHAAEHSRFPFYAIGRDRPRQGAGGGRGRGVEALRGAGDPRRRRPRRRRRGPAPGLRRAGDRPRWLTASALAAPQAQAARRPRNGRGRRAQRHGARLRQGRGAKPGGARGAAAARAGRAADRRHGRRLLRGADRGPLLGLLPRRPAERRDRQRPGAQSRRRWRCSR